MAVMALTGEIMEALHAYRAVHNASDAEIARHLGISPQHLNKIMKHSSFYVRSDTWKKMEPHLRPYLKDIDGQKKSGIVQNASGTGYVQIANAKKVFHHAPGAPDSEDANIKCREFFSDLLESADIPDEAKTKITLIYLAKYHQ